MKKISILLVALAIGFACKKKDNNEPAPSNPGSGNRISYPTPSSTSNLGLIGGVSFSTNNGRLKGKMDKIKIWNKALNSTEASAEYTNSN